MERSCRICMGNEEQTVFKSLFDESHEFAKDLFEIAGIVVFEISNNHPALICSQCEIDLETAARIRKISLESDAYLKAMSSTADIQILATLINNQHLPSLDFNVKQEPKTIKKETKGFDFDPSLIKVEIADDIFEAIEEETFEEPIIFDNGSDLEWSLNDLKLPSKVKASKSPAQSTSKPKTPRARAPKTPKEKPLKRKGNFSEKAIAQRREYQRNLPMIPCTFEGCNKSFKGRRRLKDHMAYHSDARNYSCDKCGKMFKTRTNLSTHRNNVHAEGSWSCDLCGKIFKGKAHVRTHIEKMHTDKFREICDLCGKVLHNSKTLQTHMLYTHNAEGKNFECPQCHKKYYTKARLKQHVLTHGERNWICELCSKGFTRRYKLGEHYKQVHHRKMEDVLKFVCNICSRGFDRSSNLQEHMRTAHEVVFEGDE